MTHHDVTEFSEMRPGHGWVSDARAVTLARCLDLTPLREDASVREWAADSEWGQWACLFFRCSPSGNVPSAGVPLVCACCAICYVADVSILLAMSSRPCIRRHISQCTPDGWFTVCCKGIGVYQFLREYCSCYLHYVVT